MDAPKITPQEMLEAIAGEGRWLVDGEAQPSAGNMTLIAKRLGVTRLTVYNYAKKYKKIAEAIHEQREAMKDLVENKILTRINEGSDTMIIFYAKTQMKDRGYVERQEFSGPEGSALAVVIDR